MFTYASTSLKSVGVILKPIFLQALRVNQVQQLNSAHLESQNKGE